MLLFALGILVTGIITYYTQRSLSDSAIQEQVETLANKVAEEAADSIHEYPANQSKNKSISKQKARKNRG
jgi:hypothetical protein